MSTRTYKPVGRLKSKRELRADLKRAARAFIGGWKLAEALDADARRGP